MEVKGVETFVNSSTAGGIPTKKPRSKHEKSLAKTTKDDTTPTVEGETGLHKAGPGMELPVVKMWFEYYLAVKFGNVLQPIFFVYERVFP